MNGASFNLSAMIFRNSGDHGDRCTCRLLALAVGCDPKSVSVNFCRSVLKKRWAIECNHGCIAQPEKIDSAQKWHDLGPVDPIKAILIDNE